MEWIRTLTFSNVFIFVLLPYKAVASGQAKPSNMAAPSHMHMRTLTSHQADSPDLSEIMLTSAEDGASGHTTALTPPPHHRRSLHQDTTSPPEITPVTTAQELADAIVAGKAHISILDHLDLTGLPILSTATECCNFMTSVLPPIPPSVKSITGNCSTPPPSAEALRLPESPPLLPLRSQQCLVVTDDRTFWPSGRLWIHNVYVRHSRTGRGSELTSVLAWGDTWITRCAFQADGDDSNAARSGDGSWLFIDDSVVDHIGGNIAVLVTWIAASLSVRNCTFQNITTGSSTGVIHSRYTANVRIEGCTFSDVSVKHLLRDLDEGGSLWLADDPTLEVWDEKEEALLPVLPLDEAPETGIFAAHDDAWLLDTREEQEAAFSRYLSATEPSEEPAPAPSGPRPFGPAPSSTPQSGSAPSSSPQLGSAPYSPAPYAPAPHSTAPLAPVPSARAPASRASSIRAQAPSAGIPTAERDGQEGAGEDSSGESGVNASDTEMAIIVVPTVVVIAVLAAVLYKLLYKKRATRSSKERRGAEPGSADELSAEPSTTHLSTQTVPPNQVPSTLNTTSSAADLSPSSCATSLRTPPPPLPPPPGPAAPANPAPLPPTHPHAAQSVTTGGTISLGSVSERSLLHLPAPGAPREEHLAFRKQQLENSEGKEVLGSLVLQTGPKSRIVGGQAVVQFAKDSMNGVEYAAKFFLSQTAFQDELAMYNDTSNPLGEFLPQLRSVVGNEDGQFVDADGHAFAPCIIMEKGESLDLWSRRNSDGLDMVSSLQVIHHIASSLACLHAAGYVHRDLKPSNIMWLPRKNVWTLIDFGCAARIGTEAPLLFTPTYSPPEVVQAADEKRTSMAAAASMDAWSLGVVAVELLSNKPALEILEEGQEMVMKRLRGELPMPWEAGHKRCRVVHRAMGRFGPPILELLHRDPAERPSMINFQKQCSSILLTTGTA